MSDVAIKVENLSKQYRLGEVGTGTLSHDLNRWWHRMRGNPDPYLKIGETNDRATKGNSEWVWALKDINFEVKQGEVMGIIGKNGAGKSTLLKILSKVTGPTTGRIRAKGHIASLLEVGTGFHPELTGRENIYLNGTILGMTKKEVDRKLEEIVDFAGVSRYIDTPVKRYSSGMMVRLGFSVAAHLEPDILIVDEVLAVGDADFQKKCIGKMNDISGQGRTILFVSHNMSALSSLCTKSVLLHNGEKISEGITDSIIKEYLLHNTSVLSEGQGEVIYSNEVSDDGEFIINSIRTLDENGDIRLEFRNDEPVFVEVEFSLNTGIKNLVVGIELKRGFGELIFRSFHNDINEILNYNLHNLQKIKFITKIDGGLLNGGSYSIFPCAGIHRKKWLIGGNKEIRGLKFNISFDVPNPDYVYSDNKPGLISPLLKWHYQNQV